MRILPPLPASLAPLLASLAFAVACNTPPKDPPRDGADGPIAPPATGAATAVPATGAPATSAASAPTSTSTSTSTTGSAKPVASGKPTACSGDADCRTFSSYCAEAPCACRVLAKSEGDPKCLGSGVKVSCFVDPCMKKSASCQSGACVLTAAGPAK